MPTQAVLNGDFSTIAGAGCVSGGTARTILDPTNGQPFANNQIPVSRFNPQSLNLLKYVPVASDPCGKIVYGIPQTGDEDQVVGRIDWLQSAKHNFYGRYFIADYRNPAVFDSANLLTTTRAGNLQRAQTLTLGDTYTFSGRTSTRFTPRGRGAGTTAAHRRRASVRPAWESMCTIPWRTFCRRR